MWLTAIAIVASFPNIALAANELQIVEKEQVKNCKNLGVYRGKAGQNWASSFATKQLEEKAMTELIKEAKQANATHFVKGFTYRISFSGGVYGTDMVFQFGSAYDCLIKKI